MIYHSEYLSLIEKQTYVTPIGLAESIYFLIVIKLNFVKCEQLHVSTMLTNKAS